MGWWLSVRIRFRGKAVKKGRKERKKATYKPRTRFFFAGGKKSCWKLFAIGKDGTGQDRTEVRRKRGRDGLFG